MFNSWPQVPPNIFKYARNRSGPYRLPCGTPEVTPIIALILLTPCERPKRNFPTYTTTLESTAEAAMFVSSRSCGTKWKTFEKPIIIAPILTRSPRGSAVSWQTLTIWLAHGCPGRRPHWPSYNRWLALGTLLWRVPFSCTPQRLSWPVCSLWLPIHLPSCKEEPLWLFYSRLG